VSGLCEPHPLSPYISRVLTQSSVTIVSIIRLRSLIHFAASTNPTWDYLSVSMWSTIEINVGIVCACMPSLRILLVRVFPKLRGTSNRSNNQYYAKNHSQRGGNISVIRATASSGPPDNNKITYERSYTVQRELEEDETQLVELTELGSMKSPARVREQEI